MQILLFQRDVHAYMMTSESETVSYVDTEFVIENGGDGVVQLKMDGNDLDSNDVDTVYVQQGQYVIPVDGHTVVLQDEQGDFEQYIIKNIITDEELQEADGSSSQETIEQPVVYYSGDLINYPEMLGSIDDNDGEMVLDDCNMEQENNIESNFVQVQEDVDSVMVAAGTDLQPQYHYAILKDGKLHLQMLDLLDAGGSQQDLQLQARLAAFEESISMDEPSSNEATVELDKITGKNLITGQTVTLAGYFDKLQKKLTIAANSIVQDDLKCNNMNRRDNDLHTNGSPIKYKNGSNDNSFINKKFVVGKTSTGKKLVGKIVRIEATEKTNDTSASDNSLQESAFSEEEDSPEAPDPNEGSSPIETSETLQPQVIIKKHMVSRADFDYNIGKIMAGLMDMETVRRRIINKNLIVKFVEKVYIRSQEDFNKTVSYVYGHMELVKFEKDKPESQQWVFILYNQDNEAAAEGSKSDNSVANKEGVKSEPFNTVPNKWEEGSHIIPEGLYKYYSETLSITIVITVDKDGKKATKVTLNPQQPGHYCHMCSHDFKTALKMRKHLLNVHFCKNRNQSSHNGSPSQSGSEQRCNECPKCGKSFSTASSLRRHMTIHNPLLRPLECSVCIQRFTDESSLRKHLLIHTGIRAYTCEVCNKAFVNQGDLNFHRRIHDPIKQYKCKVCSQEFSRHSNLVRHAEVHRGNGALHRCDICGCSYSFVSSLTRHIVQKHIGQQQQQ